jgi:oligopeptide/dipeptide ABC transporter ATP-binding protein
MTSPLIAITGLTVSTTDDNRTLVNDVSFNIAPGEAVGVVGESGSGKTLTALSLLGLLPRGVHATSGSITYAGKDLLHTDEESLRAIRGNEIAMIYQDPMTALNPVMKLGAQLIEVIESHTGDTSDAGNARERVLAAFSEVGIPDPKRAYDSYPHEFSGGMRQRVMIAMALILSPQLLIADEPTTALDVTIQQQILALVMQERRKRNMSMLWITHDLGVVANLVDRVIVMYAGRIVEIGSVKDVFTNPQHPYTAGLLASLPKASDKNRTRLVSIPGIPPKPWTIGQSCAFSARCSRADEQCRTKLPVLASNSHTEAACFHLMGEKA